MISGSVFRHHVKDAVWKVKDRILSEGFGEEMCQRHKKKAKEAKEI